MKVNQSHSPSVQGSEMPQTQSSGRTTGTSSLKNNDKPVADSPKAIPTDVQLELSQKSKDFLKVKAIAAEAPEVRLDRVADLKRQITEGSYSINADKVADRLVDDHLKMQGLT